MSRSTSNDRLPSSSRLPRLEPQSWQDHDAAAEQDAEPDRHSPDRLRLVAVHLRAGRPLLQTQSSSGQIDVSMK